MPSLSTHVLDLHHGTPAQNVKIEVFYQQDNEPFDLIKTVVTNADGRCDEQIVTNETWRQGTYELVFHVETYYKEKKRRPPYSKLPNNGACSLQHDRSSHSLPRPIISNSLGLSGL